MWPAQGLGLACFLAALAAATGSVARRGGSWARLVEQSLVTEKQQRSQLDAWCHTEIAAQEGQRAELTRLHDQVSSSLTSGEQLFSLSEQLEGLAATLESRESEAVQAVAQQSHVNFTFEELQKDARALGNVKSKLESKPGTFLQTRPLSTITGMLKSLHREQERVLDKIAAPAQLQSEASRLRTQFEQRARDLAHQRTRQQAAEASQELLMQALSESDMFAADLQDLCKLGADVHGRFSVEIGPVMKKLAKGYDAEDSAPSTSNTLSTTTVMTTSTSVAARTAATTAPVDQDLDPAADDAPPVTTTIKAHKPKKAKRTTTTATTTSTTLSTTVSTTTFMTTSTSVAARTAATTAPVDQDLDPAADDAPPVTTTIKEHKRKKAKGTTTTAPVDEDDDDVSLAPPRRTTTVGATQNSATMSSEALEDSNSDDMTTPAPKHHRGRTTTPAMDTNEDDFDDAPAPPVKAKKLKVKQEATPAPDASGGLPGTYNTWAPAGGANEMQNAEKTAKAQAAVEIDKYKQELMGGDDDDDDQPQPARKHSHASHHVDVDDSDDLGSSHSQKGLEGGWQALMKNGDTKKAKHTFQDESSGIMDLIQTPHTYSAWHPGSVNIKQAASSELQAAEKAFDSFLQVAATSSSSSVSAASLVLEEYGSVLESQPLVQLAHSRISATRLTALWSKLVHADASPIGDQREQTEVQWCKDFQRDGLVTAQHDRERRQKNLADMLKEETTGTVLRQQIAAERQLLQVFSKDSKALRSLQESIQHEWAATGELLAKMEAAGNEEDAKSAAALRGAVTGAGAELSDMLGAALEHRVNAEASWSKKLSEAEAASVASESRRAALEAAQEAASNVQSEVLQDRYKQMCSWALDDQEVREHHQASERKVIRIALAVMGAL